MYYYSHIPQLSGGKRETTMIIKYTSSVKTPAGWRPELITARAEKLTDKRLQVVEVLDIGGNGVTGFASRTGAKRQQYDVAYFAKQQIGVVKLINFTKVIESEV